MKNKNIFLAILIIGFIGCGDKDPVIDPPKPEVDTFELIWNAELDPEKEVVNLNQGLLYQDLYLFSGDQDDPFTIKAFSKSNGENSWEFVNDGIIQDEIDVSGIFNDIYIGVTSTGIVAVDLKNLTLKWEIDLQGLNRQRGQILTEREGKVYHTIGEINGTDQIIQIDLNSGNYAIVYETVGSVSQPAFWDNPANDQTLMICNHYPSNELTSSETIQNIVAIDLETGSEVWRMDDFSMNYSTNAGHDLVIYNNTVITGGDWSLYCFDINTGTLRWHKEIPNYDKFGIWDTTNHLLVDDKLFVNPTGDEIFCIDPTTGNFIWENYIDAPNCSDNMVYYNDMLVFTSWGNGSVMVLDALTGELIHREHRFDNSSYNNDVVYDPETDMFFTATFKHAIGFKINKPN